MIDGELLRRYQTAFGSTFNIALWENRPGDTVNDMMRVALAGYGPPVTDERIAARLKRQGGTNDTFSQASFLRHG